MKKESLYLPLLLIASFIIRMIPHRTLLLATYDEYLHKDITLRIVHYGLGSISKDIPSLLGLRAYSYPPMFHIIGAAFYKIFPSDYLFFVLPAVYGTLAVLGFYLAFKELMEDKKRALLAVTLLAFAPNFIYRTSLYIPENLGLFLFSLSMLFGIRLLKSKKIRDLIPLALVFALYMITHRGWIFFVLAALLVLVSYWWDFIKRHLHYFVALAVVAVLAYTQVSFIHSTLGELALRLQRSEVSFLGYFKWIGVVQLVFGAIASPYYFRRGGIRRGFVLWAWGFIFAGGISFRFRDPYAAIPLSAMAAEYLIDVIFPAIGPTLRKAFEGVRGFGAEWIRDVSKKRWLTSFIILLILVSPLAQGVYGAYKYVEAPTVSDKEAYEWITQNTPENATILVWWDMGYLLIGNTKRKDVVIWKKVYQGFFGEAPTVREATQAYFDHVVMFSSNQREWAYYLMKKYNVSYIFVDRRRYSYGLIRYGLMEYAPYDTHFKLEFCNGNSVIYRFIPEPDLRIEQPLPVNYTGEYSPLVNFLEKFWTGYNYADFDSRYKAYFNLNAWMVDLYSRLYKKTGDESFKARRDWLLRWLSYKEMENGAFPWGVPPNDFTLYTSYTLEPLKDVNFDGKERSLKLLKDRERGDFFMTTPKDQHGGMVTNALMLPVYKDLGILNATTEKNIVNQLLKEQRGDGSWNDNLGTTIAVASSLARYYQLTGNESVLDSVKKAAQWMTGEQEENGKLKAEKYEYAYSRATYAQMVYIYHVAGLTEAEEKTLRFIEDTFDPNREVHPLDAVLTMYRYFGYAYGKEDAIDMLNELLSAHPMPRFN
ncbi:glycosyltransferase family 39 protein [Thermococcus sp. 21S7]|uniref:glycosyltransferase family 39 protein n=1 Tax=Thermococcus sp. 21S7 TaxID=1638221 RepID=UPI00143B8502|nr:glycosyltransferase family 39 protein [Thermococcus sp. 21S7]NJE62226.1 glycosyltransferase family 39 protein [Thermococcus sp. 21S7]